jgi:hypothetical protein
MTISIFIKIVTLMLATGLVTALASLFYRFINTFHSDIIRFILGDFRGNKRYYNRNSKRKNYREYRR